MKRDTRMRVRLDCRHFQGDRPCAYHKESGALCDECQRYDGIRFKLLIIKLDALGDVLRTTCILPSLKAIYPEAHVTWLTRAEGLPLLRRNPYIDQTLTCETGGLARLQVESFNLVLNPDASKESAALATLARGDLKRGYGLAEDGQVMPFNDSALEWLEMGGRDDLKSQNRRTYQDHIHRICGLKASGQEIIIRLGSAEVTQAQGIAASQGLSREMPLVGFNPGAGLKWPQKKWPPEKYLALARMLRETSSCRVVLLGGEKERDVNSWIAGECEGWVIDLNSGADLRRYLAFIDLCDVVVTGDTLGLHAALGLGKRVVAIFGPTSPWEIDLYGRGVSVVADLDCICCYRSVCSRRPSCTESISVEEIFLEATGMLETSEKELLKLALPVGAGAGAR